MRSWCYDRVMSTAQNKINIGDTFGRLVVVGIPIYVVDSCGKKRAVLLCQCECGNTAKVRPYQLTHGVAQSCGCLQREMMSKRQTKHGEHGSQLYRKWASMRSRCNSPSHAAYADYGGRGIKVCEEWLHDYPAFRDWAYANGFEPHLSIDRIDNDGGYSPANCRWVTATVNNRNRRNSIWITAFGETKTIADWTMDSRCTVNGSTISRRINKGWSSEAAILTPKRGHHDGSEPVMGSADALSDTAAVHALVESSSL